jgi:hypothetical protein
MVNFASLLMLIASCSNLLVSANERFRQTCIENTEEFGYTKNWNNRNIESGYEMAGDMMQIAEMPLNQVAFSRPNYVIVCADN